MTPNPNLRNLVKPGSVLFEGSRAGNNYQGTAYLFSSTCPATGYPVDGSLQDDGTTIVLNGKSPVLGPDCKPVNSKPERLVFLFQSEEGNSRPGQTGSGSQQSDTSSPGSNKPPTTASARLAPACTRSTCVDREPFFRAFKEYYRTHDRGTLNWWQEDALTSTLNVWDTTPELEGERRLAYILGTAYHELTHTLYPTRECSCMTDAGSIACAKRLYEAGKASQYYLRDTQTGQSYYGRGQTQLTLKENYRDIGKNLGLGSTRLVAMPDDALTLEISAKNAVYGLYYGWYRRGLGLKDFSFDSDDDWIRARDVLIAQRRAATDVASFSRAILPMLSFISLKEFHNKYARVSPGTPAGPSEPQPTPPSGPEVGQSQPTPQPLPIPAPPPTTDAALLRELQSNSQALDEMARDLMARALDLSRKAAFLRGMLNSVGLRAGSSGSEKAPLEFENTGAAAVNLALRPASPGSEKGLDDGEKAEAAVVNFQDVWPPGHKEHAWCRTDGKALPTFDELPDDDPLVIRFGR